MERPFRLPNVFILLHIYRYLDGMGAAPGAHLGWERMNETADSEILEASRKTIIAKYVVLGLCLALFVVYGLVVG